MIERIKASVERQWYGRPHWLFLCLPLIALFIVLAKLRKRRHQRQATKPPIPVIVVGNITVGGTGKTPVIIALVQYLQQQGYRPGVVARGYGAQVQGVRNVTAQSLASEIGDEPVQVQQATGCAIMVGKDRAACAWALYNQHQCDIVLSDDGLQHYRLQRDIECVVVDASRGFGNGWRLPVGPLRESERRLADVDFILCNGDTVGSQLKQEFTFRLEPLYWQHLKSGATKPIGQLALEGSVAIAGIGNPNRFFNTLKPLGFNGTEVPFADHHPFTADDFSQFGEAIILMTSKDAVKCQSFAKQNWWVLVVGAKLPDEFYNKLTNRLSNNIES